MIATCLTFMAKEVPLEGAKLLQTFCTRPDVVARAAILRQWKSEGVLGAFMKTGKEFADVEIAVNTQDTMIYLSQLWYKETALVLLYEAC